MAAFRFELVSPQKLLFTGDVEQVDVPGAEGDFGVLARHAPLVALLRPGILTVHAPEGEQKFVVLGGFAEFSGEQLTVLGAVAMHIDDCDITSIGMKMEDLQRRIEKTDPGAALDRLIRQLDHYKALNEHLTGTAMH